jgi:hypothetical protein
MPWPIHIKYLTDIEYIRAAFKLGIRRSAATISKKVGLEPSPPTVTNDIAVRVYVCAAKNCVT